MDSSYQLCMFDIESFAGLSEVLLGQTSAEDGRVTADVVWERFLVRRRGGA